MFPSLLLYSLLFSTCQAVEMDLCSPTPHLCLSSDTEVKEGAWWRGRSKKEEGGGVWEAYPSRTEGSWRILIAVASLQGLALDASPALSFFRTTSLPPPLVSGP